jgi:hypothetical protein
LYYPYYRGESTITEKSRSFLGIGQVFQDATELGSVEYHLEVLQEYSKACVVGAASYRIPGVRQIIGTVRGHLPIRTTLTLVTEEGHTLYFSITDTRGTIDAEGPLRTNNGQEAS